MFAVRCTRKLLMRGAPDVLEAPVAPTTILGDWYANIVFTRPEHLVVCISERTLLPVVVTARNVKALPQRVADAAEGMLRAIGIEPDAVAAEAREMQGGYLGVTKNRKVLGTLTDFMFHFERSYQLRPGLSLQEHAVRLAEIPSAALGYAFPTEATRALFKAQQVTHAGRGSAV